MQLINVLFDFSAGKKDGRVSRRPDDVQNSHSCRKVSISPFLVTMATGCPRFVCLFYDFTVFSISSVDIPL